MKNSIASTLKLFLVVTLLVMLFRKGFVSYHAMATSTGHPLELIMGGALSFVAVLLGALRFHFLLKSQQIAISFSRALKLSLIGSFYSLGLPGSVSGDLVKGAYLRKMTPEKRSEAYAAILADRLSGLVALVLISSFALILNSVFGLNRFILTFQFSIYGLLFLTSICVYCIFGLNEGHDPLFIFIFYFSRKTNFLNGIFHFYRSFKSYRRQISTMLRALLLSVCIHVAVCGASIFFLCSLGADVGSQSNVFIVLPLALLALSFPVLPLGFGTGHFVFWYLFHFVGTDQGANLYNLRILFAICVAALGGLVALKWPVSFKMSLDDLRGRKPQGVSEDRRNREGRIGLSIL